MHAVTHLLGVVEARWRSKIERKMQVCCAPELDPEYEPLRHRMSHLTCLVENSTSPEGHEHLFDTQAGPNVDAVVGTWKED